MKRKQSVEQSGETEIVDRSQDQQGESDQDRSDLQQPCEIIMRSNRGDGENIKTVARSSPCVCLADLIPVGQPFLRYWRPMTKRSANNHNLL